MQIKLTSFRRWLSACGVLTLLAVGLPLGAQDLDDMQGGPDLDGAALGVPAGPGPGMPMGGQFRDQAGQRPMGALAGKLLLEPSIKQQLALSPDQVGKIEKLNYDAEKTAIQLEAQIKQALLDLRVAIKPTRPERTKVLAQVDTLGKLRTALHKANVNYRLNLRDVLTDTQVQMVQAMIQQHKAGWREKAAERRPERGAWMGRRGPKGAAPRNPAAPKPPAAGDQSEPAQL